MALLNRYPRKQQNSMVSSLMCSLNPNTIRSLFWIDQPLSWKILLLLLEIQTSLYRVTDEALIAETMVWPNFFLKNIFFALKGSNLFSSPEPKAHKVSL